MPGSTHIFKVAMYVSVYPLLCCSLNLTFNDFLGGAMDKNPSDNAGDMGSIPDLGRFHMAQSNEAPVPQPLGEGNGTPLQYSCLENSTGGGAW